MGLRASGKSTVGALLAERLGRPFIDLDDETMKYLGPGTIAELFERVGEARFRAAEYRALVNQAFPRTKPGPIVALGGGTPAAPGAADFIREATSRGECLVVYLRTRPTVLEARLREADNRHRPALVGDDAASEVQQVFDTRDPLYRELATIEIDASGAALAVSDDVVRALGSVS